MLSLSFLVCNGCRNLQVRTFYVASCPKNTLNTRNKHVTNQMHEVTGSILLHPDWHFFFNNINMKIDAIFANTDPRFNICFYNISDRN